MPLTYELAILKIPFSLNKFTLTALVISLLNLNILFQINFIHSDFLRMKNKINSAE
jgi:hypothetical protein